MKRIIMTLAVAGVLLGFSVPGQPSGLALGPSSAKADGGFVFYYGGGGHKHGHHGKHHRKHYGKHHHNHHHKRHYRHHRKHYYKHHHKHHRPYYARPAKHHYRHAKRRHYGGGCHPVSKEGYWRGRPALIGGTMCYGRHGRGYVVDGSRYLIHYY